MALRAFLLFLIGDAHGLPTENPGDDASTWLPAYCAPRDSMRAIRSGKATVDRAQCSSPPQCLSRPRHFDGGAYVIEPAAGLATLSAAERRAKPPGFLFDDLAQRLATGPVRFALVAQMAAPGDPTNDIIALWPAGREHVTLGAIEVTSTHADQTEERGLFYDPNNLPDGTAPSDDPLLPARQQAYGVSIAHRTAAP